ncbi:hypothetical protein ZWY2020_040579 [Hordeum vulgare]|nr:hypothetical protein ZWY2020_040579 [Hordeum vulgare]
MSTTAHTPASLSGDSSPTTSGSSSPSSAAAVAGSYEPALLGQAISISTPAASGDDAAVPTSPQIGMYFETEDDAYEFYKAYATRLGFVVRKSNKSKNSRHTVTRRLFVCSKQGFRQEPKKPQDETNVTVAAPPPPPRCPDSRTGCLASLTIKLLPSANAFRVTEFVAEHNHQLASAASAVSLAMIPSSSSHRSIAAAASLPDPRDGPSPEMHFETEDDAYAFYNRLIASRAAKSEEAMSYIESQSSVLVKHLDDILQTGYPENGNHAVASSSQAISFVGNHPDHTTQARAVAHTENGLISLFGISAYPESSGQLNVDPEDLVSNLLEKSC